MKHNTMLTVASLLSLLFLTLHITDDIVRGISKAESSNTAARPRGLTVRDTRAPRTAIGARHHAAHRIVRSSHARPPHEGGTLRRDRQIPRRLFLRLDTLGARRARGLHLDPLGARAMGSATEAAPVVQGKGRPRFLPIGCCNSNYQRRSVYRRGPTGSKGNWLHFFVVNGSTRRGKIEEPYLSSHARFGKVIR